MSSPVAGASHTPTPDAYRLTGRSVGSLVGVFVLLLLLGAASFLRLPYVVMSPGPISNTLGKIEDTTLISVSGTQTYPTEGELDFTTVRVLGGPGHRVTLWDILAAWFDPAEEVVGEEVYFPKGITDKQVEEENTAEMLGSQQEAIAVALRSLGHPVTQRVLVGEVAKDAPSAGLFTKGDQIVSVDGKSVSDSAAVRAAVSRHKPGERVEFVLRRDGKDVPVSATTRDSQGRTTVGIYLGVDFDYPFDVKITAGDVGGPSAGTMFALGVYDVLTPGALTGGQKVAGTGTIDSTGRIGPIGGIRQKLVGAKDGGARWFLAPAQNCGEVRGQVPEGLRVVKVATFTEARDAVAAIGAKRAGSLPTC